MTTYLLCNFTMTVQFSAHQPTLYCPGLRCVISGVVLEKESKSSWRKRWQKN